MNELEAFQDTIRHIQLVQRLLLSAQFELSKRIVSHDQSKLEPPEWEMFANVTADLATLTYGSEEYDAQIAKMKAEGHLFHHYANNRHHPEHFENGIDGMTLFDLLEMLIDWSAATKRHNDGDIHESLKINADRFSISPQLIQILANTVPWINDQFSEIHYQSDISTND